MEVTEEQANTFSADVQSWEAAYGVPGEAARPATGWESQLVNVGERLPETLCTYLTHQPA